jgi:hypothetical protein
MMRIGYRKVVTYVTMKYERKDIEFFGIIRNKVVFTVKNSRRWEEVFQYLGSKEVDVYMKEIISYMKI